jgi:hypothetical protein
MTTPTCFHSLLWLWSVMIISSNYSDNRGSFFLMTNALSAPSSPDRNVPFSLTTPTTTTSTSTPSSNFNKNNLQYLQAILWDMDGVLADTERDAHRPAFNQVFQQENLDTEWTEEIYGKLLEVGGGKERMTAHWTKVGWPTIMQDMTETEKQDKVKELHLRKTNVFVELINGGDVPLRPGVLRVIDSAIDAGLTLAVCSTSNEQAVRNLVQSKCL